jgi:hypothetical protein
MPSRYTELRDDGIEAMTCGVPVIAADRGALPEAAGAAARLVDPDDAAVAAAIAGVIADLGCGIACGDGWRQAASRLAAHGGVDPDRVGARDRAGAGGVADRGLHLGIDARESQQAHRRRPLRRGFHRRVERSARAIASRCSCRRRRRTAGIRQPAVT